MLTARGWWLLLILVFLLTITLCAKTTALALVCLTLLMWLLVSLISFHLRIRFLISRLQVIRQLRDERGPVQSLWVERTFTVHVQLAYDGLLPSPYVRVTDREPFGGKRLAGELLAEGTIRPAKPLALTWHLHCAHPGVVRFEGVKVQFADLQGFFYYATFVRAPMTMRVLPAFVDARGHVATVKRDNILPLAGPHRFPRPGSGSELLDLRDYMPGDPPKTIAWKVSARRNRLITKVFESEVPLRCTFFVDVSDSVRAGSVGQNALARLVEMTSALAQATAAFRDLPGLCLFDQERVQRVLKPARTPRHVIQIMNELAATAALSPASTEFSVAVLLPLAYGFAEEVYPDLLDKSVNQMPWWLPWWSPRSAATIRTVPRKRRRTRSARLAGRVEDGWRYFKRRLRQGFYGRISGIERQRYRWRKRLSALLSVLHDMGAGGLALLQEHDELLVTHMQRFLAEHHVPYAPPLIGPRGEYLFASPNKIKVLAAALTRALAHCKDNEMFVLMVDLLELDAQLGPLLAAVKAARARHHEVVVVSPWPPAVPVPDPKLRTQPAPSFDVQNVRDVSELGQFLERATHEQLHYAYYKLRRAFGKIGITMICAQQTDSIKLILERMERLRQPLRGIR